MSKEQPYSVGYTYFGHPDVIDIFRGNVSKFDSYGHQIRKVALALLGGGQAGNLGGGALSGFQDHDKIVVADGILGSSCGVPNMMAAATANYKTIPVYHDANTRKDGLIRLPTNPTQMIRKAKDLLIGNREGAFMDTAIVGREFRKNGLMDIDAIKNSNQELLAHLWNIDTGAIEFHDVRSMMDPITAVDAGVCVPGLSMDSYVRMENGMRYCDAYFADPFPIEALLARGYTDILMIANMPVFTRRKSWRDSLVPYLHAALASHPRRGYNPLITARISQFENSYDRGVSMLKDLMERPDRYHRVGLLEPTVARLCNPMEVNAETMKKTYWQTRDDISHLLMGGIAENRAGLY